jgi:RHS repeat-associated protein
VVQKLHQVNSLSRLTSSLNPETGTTPVTYSYDADNNVSTKKDARGITISYSWDVVKRMLGRAYSNGDPSVSYSYDSTSCVVVSSCYNVGHMTGMTDAAGSENFAYDTMGRLWGDRRTTNSITKNASYVYNLDGSLNTLNYPSGHSVAYTVGGAGLPLSAADSALTSSAYAASGGYTAWGARNWTTYGGYIGENILFNTRLQPCWTFVSSVAGISTTSCTGTETSSGNLMDVQYNFNVGADNGNLIGITNHRNANRSQTYGYDAVNRITSAATASGCTASCWSLTFGLDQWANLETATATGTATQVSLSVGTNNQITTTRYTYDASGNETADVTSTYAWNAESEMKTGGGVTYVYDGRGRRVEKSGSKLYWYGPSGEVLDETDATGSTANITFSEYVYFDGERLARRDYLNNVYYYFEDQVKSSRVIAEIPVGTTTPTLCYDADFYPYGGEIDFTSTCAQNYKFDGKERDSETGNDYFGARYYSSAYGRFLSPDWSSVPVPVPYANLANPQTLNLYAFVDNNPESFADLDGHCCDLSDVINFVAGATNAYASDNLAGAGRQTQGTAAGKIGQAVGDAAAAFDGAEKAVAGGSLFLGGTGADSTGAGAIVGVPAQALGAAIAVQGGSEAIQGSSNLLKSALGPKAADAPGVTAGGQATDEHGNKLGPSNKPQLNETNSNTREATGNRALNEGPGKVEHANPKTGKPHFHPADKQGNKKPSSTHHNYPD